MEGEQIPPSATAQTFKCDTHADIIGNICFTQTHDAACDATCSALFRGFSVLHTGQLASEASSNFTITPERLTGRTSGQLTAGWIARKAGLIRKCWPQSVVVVAVGGYFSHNHPPPPSQPPNRRKTSFEKSLPSGSHHPLHLSARHARPWEKRSSVWYALPVPHMVVT